MTVEYSVVCCLDILDDHTQFITVNLSQSRDGPGKHPSYIGKMRIGGSRQDVVRRAQNHLDGLCGVCEVPGVSEPPPPDLDPLKSRESLRYLVKSFGAPGECNFRHASIMRVSREVKRVKVLEFKGYMSSWGSCGDVFGRRNNVCLHSDKRPHHRWRNYDRKECVVRSMPVLRGNHLPDLLLRSEPVIQGMLAYKAALFSDEVGGLGNHAVPLRLLRGVKRTWLLLGCRSGRHQFTPVIWQL
jgi:hypothetical protein